MAGAGASLERHLGLPHECSGPKDLGHLVLFFLEHLQGAGFEVQQLDSNLALSYGMLVVQAVAKHAVPQCRTKDLF